MGVVPRLEDSLLLAIPAIPAGCFSHTLDAGYESEGRIRRSRPQVFGDREEDLSVLTSQTAYDVLNWPCIRSRPKARKPPTRSCARGEEPKATEFDCGASSYWIEWSTSDPFLVES